MKRKQFTEKDYIGKKFNSLTIIKFTKSEKAKTGQLSRRCICECECESRKGYYLSNITAGRTKSCGCKEVIGSKNNISLNPLYPAWQAMMRRCYDPKDKAFKNYGKRGIDVYKDWHKPEDFLRDVGNIIGEKPSDIHSLDRIDNNRGYHPDNIRWATPKEQANNTRLTYDITAGNLAKLTGYTRERIRQLTYPNTSSKGKKYPLRDFVEKIIRTGEYTHYIYKPSAIQFLLNRKNNH